MGMLEDDLTEDAVNARRMKRVDEVLAAVRAEVERAIAKHRPMAGPHEGYAVILEELDELWDEVKADRGRLHTGLKEAIQTAAMGVRYVADLAPEKYNVLNLWYAAER